MTFHLTVRQPFGDYKRGDRISDPVKVAELLAGEHIHSLIKSFPKPEHASGDFHRTDAELAEKVAKKKAA